MLSNLAVQEYRRGGWGPSKPKKFRSAVMRCSEGNYQVEQ